MGWQDPKLFPALLARRRGREGYIQASTAFWQKIQSPAYPIDPVRGLERAGETFDRGFSASG